MKRNTFKALLAILVCPALLSSCQTGGATDSCSSSSSQTSTPVEDDYRASTINTSEYGYVEPDLAMQKVGENVVYTVSSYLAGYVPAGLVVNGNTLELDENNTVTVAMAEEGNTVTPLFRADLSSVEVHPDYYTISVDSFDGAEYSMDGETWQAESTFSGLTPHSSYSVYIRVPGDGDTLLDSETKKFDVETVPHRETALYNIALGDIAFRGTVSMTASSLGEELYSSTLTTEMALTSDHYTFAMSGEGSDARETYYRSDNNRVAVKSVNYLNEVSTTVMDTLVFTDTFVNPFTQMTADNVYLDEDETTLHFNIDQLTALDLFATMFLADSSITITDLSLKVDENLEPLSLDLEGYYMDTSYVGLKWEVSYTADFVDPSTVVDSDEAQPFETLPEHQALGDTFEALKGQNYTVEKTATTSTNSADPVTTHTKLISVDNATLLEYEDGTATGFCQRDDGFYRFQVAERDGEQVLERTAGPYTGITIDSLRPNFTMAPEVFEYSDGTYHLRYTVDMYNYADYVLPDFCDEVLPSAIYITDDTLDIVLNEDGSVTIKYEFAYEGTDYPYDVYSGEVELTVSNIGSTTFPYDIDNLVEAA